MGAAEKKKQTTFAGTWADHPPPKGVEEQVHVSTVPGALVLQRTWGRPEYSEHGESFRVKLLTDRYRDAKLDRAGAAALRDALDRMLNENPEPKRRPSARRKR